MEVPPSWIMFSHSLENVLTESFLTMNKDCIDEINPETLKYLSDRTVREWVFFYDKGQTSVNLQLTV